LVGKAQEEGFLSIDDSTSTYLGQGWTNCTPAQEGKMTIRHQISMTSGLDDGVADNHCTAPACLKYIADAGTRWAYHNAPYTLLDDVLTAATGQNLNTYTQSKVKSKTGINGGWFKLDDNNVYFSTPRSMARYGLLAQNNFVWNTDTLLIDVAYRNQMVNTSQNYNLSYGYLWWLNGKPSHMLPTLQLVIPGSYAPNAPADMFAAIGKNGQIASISKSKGLVMIRMGDAPGTDVEVPTQFCDQIWLYLNKVICNNAAGFLEPTFNSHFLVYPTPASSFIHLDLPQNVSFKVTISTILAQKVIEHFNATDIDISELENGLYLLQIETANGNFSQKLLKQ
jgi:CubicO group peptidase (beta-lactamase class C family)